MALSISHFLVISSIAYSAALRHQSRGQFLSGADMAYSTKLIRGFNPLINYKPGDKIFGEFRLGSFLGIHQGGVISKRSHEEKKRRAKKRAPAEGKVLGKPSPLVFPDFDFSVVPFDVDKYMGSGFFGDVWSAETEKGELVVLKFLVDHNTRQHKFTTEATQEEKDEFASDCDVPRAIEAASQADSSLQRYSRHFAKCYKSTVHSKERVPLYVALEHAGSGCKNLQNWVETNRRKVTHEQMMDFTKQLFEALSLLHSLGYVHQDVKPENIMIRADKTLWLLDFGKANHLTNPKDYTSFGDMRWMGPESFEAPVSSIYVDMWSAGLTVMYMFTGTEFGQHFIEQAKAARMPDPTPQIRNAQSQLQGSHDSIQRLLQSELCSSSSRFCQRSGLFEHVVAVPTEKGRSTENMPVVIAILSKVFRPLQRSDNRSNRWDAKRVLNILFGVGSGVVPRLPDRLRTFEKRIPINNAMHGLMRGSPTPANVVQPMAPVPIWPMPLWAVQPPTVMMAGAPPGHVIAAQPHVIVGHPMPGVMMSHGFRT